MIEGPIGPVSEADPLKQQIADKVGAEAIFCERPQVALVRVESVRADDWGVTVKVGIIPAPGLPIYRPGAGELSACWDIFICRESYWAASYVNWLLCFHPEAIREVMSLAAQLSDIDDHRKKCVILKECMNRWCR
jgi:hypothetical protein